MKISSNRKGILILAFALLLLLSASIDDAVAYTISYAIKDRIDTFSSGPSTPTDVVSFIGSKGTIDFPLSGFGVVEMVVGTLSITADLPTGLPIGNTVFDFPLRVTINGISSDTTNQLILSVDQSNDGATLQGGTGLTNFSLPNGITIGFQTLTASTGAANDGVTLTAPVYAQFYKHGSPVPEPSTIIMVGVGTIIVMLARKRGVARERDETEV